MPTTPRRGAARRAPALLACAALGACVHTLNIPQPAGPLGARLPPLDPSRIDVPLRADVRSSLAALETQVPADFTSGTGFTMIPGTPVGVRYTVHRAPFQFAAVAGALHAETTLAIAAEACLGLSLGISLPIIGSGGCQPVASCGVNEPPRQVVVSTITSLRLDPQWHLTSETRAAPPVFRDRCELTAFRIDVSDMVSDLVAERVAQATRSMDAGIAAHGDMRPRALGFWSTLQEPVALGEGFWLVLAPQTVRAGPLALGPETMQSVVGITARPHVTSGARPDVAALALPLLESAGPVEPADGLHVTFDAEVSFADATEMVAREFRNTDMTLEGHRVTIRDIRVEGRGGALLFAVDVRFASGPFNNSEGTVYLAGLPDYDAASGNLVVRQLDYTLETRNALLSAAEWFMQGSLRDSLASRARFPLRARIERLRTSAQGALQRSLGSGAAMTGALTAVRPLGAFVTPTGVVVRVVADGHAEVTQDMSQMPLTGTR